MARLVQRPVVGRLCGCKSRARKHVFLARLPATASDERLMQLHVRLMIWENSVENRCTLAEYRDHACQATLSRYPCSGPVSLSRSTSI